MAAFWLCTVLLAHLCHAVDFIHDGNDYHQRVQDRLWSAYKQRIEALPYNVTSQKITTCIMTRDDVCLSTNIFFPDPKLHGHGPYNVLYANTPYGKSSLDSDAGVANDAGWVFMGQDMRGRGQSNGSYAFWRTQGNDSLDSIQWTIAQNWSNGEIGVIGVSANCLSQYADITGVTQFDENSAEWNEYMPLFLRIVFGQLFLGDGMGYETVYPGGAYRTGLISGWLGPYIHENATIEVVQENEVFTAEYWQPLAGPYQDQWHWSNMSALHFAGWYDIFGNYQIDTVLYINSTGLNIAKGNQILIVDPGGHCPLGAIPWVDDLRGWELVEVYGIPALEAAYRAGPDNITAFNVHDHFPFNVYFYVLGPSIEEEGLYWVQALSFPEYTNKLWYLSNEHLLSETAPTDSNQESYVYNPMDPVPTWGGSNFLLQPCGPQNQNHVEKGRKDVLQFTSDVLNTTYAIVGPIRVNLFVGSDAVDTDFTANVVDVFPDGRRMLVQDGIFRMRWRNAAPPPPYATAPAPAMQKGVVYNISIDIGHMSYIFNAGHKIGVSVSSSNYERYSVNYNSGNMVIDGDKDWKNATNLVYWGGKYPSSVSLPIVELEWLQQRKIDWQEFDRVKAEREKEYALRVQENMKKLGLL